MTTVCLACTLGPGGSAGRRCDWRCQACDVYSSSHTLQPVHLQLTQSSHRGSHSQGTAVGKFTSNQHRVIGRVKCDFMTPYSQQQVHAYADRFAWEISEMANEERSQMSCLICAAYSFSCVIFISHVSELRRKETFSHRISKAVTHKTNTIHTDIRQYRHAVTSAPVVIGTDVHMFLHMFSHYTLTHN